MTTPTQPPRRADSPGVVAAAGVLSAAYADPGRPNDTLPTLTQDTLTPLNEDDRLTVLLAVACRLRERLRLVVALAEQGGVTVREALDLASWADEVETPEVQQ